MYGMVQQEAWRLRPEEIRREVAALRLEKAAREDREGRHETDRTASGPAARRCVSKRTGSNKTAWKRKEQSI